MAQALTEKDVEAKQATPAGRAGFVMPGGDGRAKALESEKRKKRAGQFLELLAAYYGVQPQDFDALTARDNTEIAPLLDAFSALNQPRSRDEALVARNDLGSQIPFDIRMESVMARKGEEMTMTMAIDMALAAKANPAFAKGVDVTGNAEERAMLLAAAELVGLTVLNEKSIKPNLLEQYRQEAAREWETLKQIAATREQLSNEEAEASAAKEQKPENTAPPSVAQELNKAAEKPGEKKPVEPVATAPEKPRAEAVPPVATAFEQMAKQEPPSAGQKKTAAEILGEGGISPDLYALVRYRVIQDNDARVRHVEDIIGLDNNIEGSTKKARVILKALEAEGVVVQDRPRGPRRVVRPADWQPPAPDFGKPGPG